MEQSWCGQSITSIRDNQFLFKSSSHSLSRSSQDQIRSKGISHSPFSSFLSSSSSHNSGNSNFCKGFQSTNQFGCRCCFKALVPTVNVPYFLFSIVGLVVASGQHSRIHQGSSCHIMTALPSHPGLAVASRQQSWSTSTL